MTRWDYHQELIPVQPQQIHAVCAAAGRDGWELCGMLPLAIQPMQKLLTPGVSLPNQTAVMLQFKRPADWESRRDMADAIEDSADAMQTNELTGEVVAAHAACEG